MWSFKVPFRVAKQIERGADGFKYFLPRIFCSFPEFVTRGVLI